jgi:filamentous hemagglutinin family protein
MNNKIYRLVFSKTRGMLVAVAEIVLGRGKGSTRARSAQRNASASPVTFFPVKALALAACVALGAHYELAIGQALPTGGVVVGGAANIAQTAANKMVISQSTNRAVVNWQTFNVGAGNTVQFVQPSASSQILNRVVGVSGPSQILGTLTANGQVFIVNSQGVVFGNGAVVNVGSLLAATKDISPSSFMAGGPLTFSGGSNGSGLISNEGALNASAGFITLVGDQVRNTGSLTAPNGQIALASGDQATLTLSNGQLVQLTLGASANNASILNSGVISAQGGKVLLTANATNSLLNSVINLSGVVSAQGGAIAVDGGSAANITVSNAVLDVANTQGVGGNLTITSPNINLNGNVSVLASGSQGGGTVVLAGNSTLTNSQVTVLDSTINVSGTQTGAPGGTIVLSGNQVGLFGNTTIDASGVAQGGKVILGGDRLSKVADTINVTLANQTYIGANTSIDIGSAQGDGGFVETSGQELTMLGNVRGISKGNNGQWLIDPTDITIGSSASTATNTSNTWNSTLSSAVVNNASIGSALSSGLNVTVTTAGSGGGTGNLFVYGDIIKTDATNSTLTLYANTSLGIGSVNVCATGTGSLGLTATAANGTLTLGSSNINLNGGNGNLTGGTTSLASNGVDISTGNATNLFMNGGVFNITGRSYNVIGVSSRNFNITQSGGTINILGVSNTSSGIRWDPNASNLVNVTAGNLNVNGTSLNSNGNGIGLLAVNISQSGGAIGFKAYANGSENAFIFQNTNLSISGGTFNITSTSNRSAPGININYLTLNQSNGSVSLTGTSNSSSGISLSSLAILNVSGGNLTLNGTSLTGKGLYSSGNITQTGGNISMSGVSQGSDSGIYFEYGSFISSGGNLYFNGTTSGTTGVDFNTVSSSSPNAYKFKASNTFIYSSRGDVKFNPGSAISIYANNLTVKTDTGNIYLATPLNVSGNLSLLAGTAISAGNVSGGDVAITSSSASIKVGASSTVTIFSGNASAASYSSNTTTLQTNITGANSTGLYYKTYNATFANIAPVAGTRNYYYRLKPNLTIGSTSNKVYDTTTNATGTISGGLIDGDSASSARMQFSNASAGTQTINTSAGAVIASTNASWNVSGYGISGTPSATISQANVYSNGSLTVADKVYDTTTNAAISGGYIVALGNASLANGSLAANTTFTNFNITGGFANASAGTQAVNITYSLTDTTNYTLQSGASSGSFNTTATISKAQIQISSNGSVANKTYDGLTNATLATYPVGTVFLGNSARADGSLVGLSPADLRSYVRTAASFASPNVGNQTVNFQYSPYDSTNFYLSRMSGDGFANIFAIPVAASPAITSETLKQQQLQAFVLPSMVAGAINLSPPALVATVPMQSPIKVIDAYVEKVKPLELANAAPVKLATLVPDMDSTAVSATGVSANNVVGTTATKPPEVSLTTSVVGTPLTLGSDRVDYRIRNSEIALPSDMLR